MSARERNDTYQWAGQTFITEPLVHLNLLSSCRFCIHMAMGNTYSMFQEALFFIKKEHVTQCN